MFFKKKEKKCGIFFVFDFKNKKFLAFFCTVMITSLSILGAIFLAGLVLPEQHNEGFVPTAYGRNISERVTKAKDLKIPKWIDRQIISKHEPARTGTELVDIDDIVVHYVGNPGSTAQNNRDYFDTATTKVSSHFVVGLDGEIIQCVPLYEKSAASGSRNRDTISIEVCHPDDSGKFSKKTYESLKKLCLWLCYEFDLDEEDILRHYDVTGKCCPKYYVKNPSKWEEFKIDIEEGLDTYE